MGFRNGKPSRQFTAIPNSLIRDDNLTDSTFRLICWVASHDENFDISFTVIERYLGYKRDKIRSAIKNAEENDYLVRVHENHPQNGKFNWQYYIFTNKEDTKLFRQEHPSIGRSPIGRSPIGGSSIGGSSNVGESTPDIEKQYEKKQYLKKQIQEDPIPVSIEVDAELEETMPQSQHELPSPNSLTSVFTKPEFSSPTQDSSSGSIIAVSLAHHPQTFRFPPKQRFDSIEDLLNQVLLDPGIMASDSLPAVYKNEIKLRSMRFPWRTTTRDKIYQTCDHRLVTLIAKERAKWSGCEWTEKIPTVIKSIGNWESSKGGLEELLGYWSKVIESAVPPAPEPQQANKPVGYYAQRSLDWHKATFSELLDQKDLLGSEQAIANFTLRYDQQHTGATAGWLNWLQTNYPQIYAHLDEKAGEQGAGSRGAFAHPSVR